MINDRRSGLKAFFDEYGTLALVLALPLSMVLCLLQYFIKPHSMLLIIIGLLISGSLLLIFGLEAIAHKAFRNLSSIGAGLLGLIFLIWAAFLIFKPESQVTTKTRMFFETRSKAVSAKEIEVSLEILPTTYYPGDKGLISIRVENTSEYDLVLDNVMFEAKKKFYDGFVVNYESAIPPIGERKEKLGVSIALFFGEEQILIPPGEAADFQVEIVAKTPGDYTGEYYAVLLVGLNSKAMPRGIPEVTEEFFLVVLADE